MCGLRYSGVRSRAQASLRDAGLFKNKNKNILNTDQKAESTTFISEPDCERLLLTKFSVMKVSRRCWSFLKTHPLIGVSNCYLTSKEENRAFQHRVEGKKIQPPYVYSQGETSYFTKLSQGVETANSKHSKPATTFLFNQKGRFWLKKMHFSNHSNLSTSLL